jgi:hypothetical protein
VGGKGGYRQICDTIPAFSRAKHSLPTSSLLGANNLITYVSNTVRRKSKASIIIDHSVCAKPLLDISKHFARCHTEVGGAASGSGKKRDEDVHSRSIS